MSTPPYEITGNIQRIDERDTLFSREALAPGSAHEQEYHARFPERAEVDRALARFIEDKMAADSPADAWDKAIYGAHFVTTSALALPDMVDGPGEGTPVVLDPKDAAMRLKAFAASVGADDVRVGPLRPQWVYSHRGNRPFFPASYVNPPYFDGTPEGYQGAAYGDPLTLDHPRALVMAFGQDLDRVQAGVGPAADHEVGAAYLRGAAVAVQLARFIRSLGYSARAHHLRNTMVMLVPVAVDAGLGELGRCGYVLSKELGANFRLAAVTTDMPLALDPPVDLKVRDFCSACKKCARTCPAGAISDGDPVEENGTRRWVLDREACLLYWGKAGSTCTICQSVCPWTKPRTLFHRVCAGAASRWPALHGLMVAGDDLLYGKTFRRKPTPEWLQRPS
jgi:reductive dehalogenase